MFCACHTAKVMPFNLWARRKKFLVQAIIININGSLTNNLTKFALLENYCILLFCTRKNFCQLFFPLLFSCHCRYVQLLNCHIHYQLLWLLLLFKDGRHKNLWILLTVGDSMIVGGRRHFFILMTMDNLRLESLCISGENFITVHCWF